MSITHERARVASLSRSRSADDPELLEARRNLNAERLAAAIRKAVDAAPPLSDEQRNRLTALLHRAPAHARVATTETTSTRSGGGLHGAA